ncbi:hypothetical protein [Kitasatospora fiedleri]|uniref:hypothetical protein n=1 Tax=Kitasatospora fiedleri TaxID=2991545 RepID=UPI00249A0B32|nr:hypothetical protein [Kitasatospora fiedleri]
MIVLSGFSSEGWGFDAVGRVRPQAHRFHAEGAEFHNAVFVTSSAYSEEISGVETADQTAERYKRILRAADLDRSASPYVLSGFDSPKSDAGTIGDLPLFVSSDRLAHELREMGGVPDAYLKLRDQRSENCRIEWSDQWRISGRDRKISVTADEFQDRLDSVIDR